MVSETEVEEDDDIRRNEVCPAIGSLGARLLFMIDHDHNTLGLGLGRLAHRTQRNI